MEIKVDTSSLNEYVHIIIDYSFLYYRYTFQLDSGKMQHLTAPIPWKGVILERDISQVYYSLREIESLRRRYEKGNIKTIISICFDSPSMRKGLGDTSNVSGLSTSESSSKQYKSNRVKRLTEEDYDNMEWVKELLYKAGYNVYKLPGYEADDLIHYLANTYESVFYHTIIVTPDLDLAVNITPKTSLMRFKSTVGYSNIRYVNFTESMDSELKTTDFPYNAILLFKSTVGDKSDNISGIKRFGPAAFNKLVNALNSDINDHLSGIENGVNFSWEEMVKPEVVLAALNYAGSKQYITSDQLTQALDSLSLVAPIDNSYTSTLEFAVPNRQTSREQRMESYGIAKMVSLYD